jgi:hypothetical protein
VSFEIDHHDFFLVYLPSKTFGKCCCLGLLKKQRKNDRCQDVFHLERCVVDNCKYSSSKRRRSVSPWRDENVRIQETRSFSCHRKQWLVSILSSSHFTIKTVPLCIQFSDPRYSIFPHRPPTALRTRIIHRDTEPVPPPNASLTANDFPAFSTHC